MFPQKKSSICLIGAYMLVLIIAVEHNSTEVKLQIVKLLIVQRLTICSLNSVLLCSTTILVTNKVRWTRLFLNIHTRTSQYTQLKKIYAPIKPVELFFCGNIKYKISNNIKRQSEI